MHIIHILICSICLLAVSCSSYNPPKKAKKNPVAKQVKIEGESAIPLDRVNLPEGFVIEVFAAGVENARSMTRSSNGTLYVGTRSEGNVYALPDADQDHKADEVKVIAEGWNMPNGVAWKDGDLYVAEVNQVRRFKDIDNRLGERLIPEFVYKDYPTDEHHGWKFISFGPDGKLYVPVGAPCNICNREEKIYNSITRLDPTDWSMEVVHQGVRNTVGFTWHPTTKEMWFTDNGRDWLGDDSPACELNRAAQDNMHFGYPFCHQGDLSDPKFGDLRSCDEFTPPAQNLGPHVAPLGCEFIPAGNFPKEYQGHMLIAEHGSWNRSKKIGYRLSLVKVSENTQATSYTTFADGWLQNEGGEEEVWGRPVDLEWLPDGTLLVSDDYADVIYRIRYVG